MTLADQIGQLLIIGYHGAFPEDEGCQTLAAQIKSSLVGGLIQYGYNITGPDQIQDLNRFFLQVATDAGQPPLFTTVDQEGGKVQRLLPSKGFQGFPSAESMPARPDEEVAKIYATMADELQASGFNWDFAPSVDMNPKDYVSPILGALERVYGQDTKTIVHYAGIMIDVFHEKGLLNCIKHFPGHGSAKKDSHQGFVDVTDVWHASEMEPFFKLCKQGKVDAVMTAHVFNAHLDPGHPATLSKVTLNKLRQKGFEGVIISDDLHMSAIQEKYDFEDALIKAFQAGNDMVIYSNNPMAAASIPNFQPDPELPIRFRETLLKAVDDGLLSKTNICKSYERVMKLKERLKTNV